MSSAQDSSRSVHRGALFALSFVFIALFVASSDANAFPATCSAAERTYQLEQRDVLAVVADYALCISQTFPRNECSSQFETLRKAQKAFALAVADARQRCGQ